MIAAIFTVIFLVGITLMVHYEVLRGVSDYLPYLKISPRKRIIVIVFAAFTAHTIEVWIYAAAYYLFVHVLNLGSFGGEHEYSFFDYLYFSTVTYTSLGLGDIFPVAHVRLIAGVEALNGLVLIGWTGSFTYLAMERLWPMHPEWRTHRRTLHINRDPMNVHHTPPRPHPTTPVMTHPADHDAAG